MHKRVKKASEPIRRPPEKSPAPPTAEEVRQKEAICIAEAIKAKREWLSAAHFQHPIEHTKIKEALYTWYNNVVGRNPDKIYLQWGIGHTYPFDITRIRPWRDAENTVEALRSSRISKASLEMLTTLDSRPGTGDEYHRSPARVCLTTCITRLSALARETFSSGYLRVIPSLAAVTIGAARIGDRRVYEEHQLLLEAFKAGCMFVWQGKDVIRYATRPYHTEFDSQGRLHSDKGPALIWMQDIGYYMWHGSNVDKAAVMIPLEKITSQMIDDEWNTENRRVLLERWGEDNYIVEKGMVPVDEHPKFGSLYVRYFSAGRPVARLRVVNSTAEPDGTFRIYWLPINPDLYNGDAGRFAQAAAASTWRTTPGGAELFFKRWRDYDPIIET